MHLSAQFRCPTSSSLALTSVPLHARLSLPDYSSVFRRQACFLRGSRSRQARVARHLASVLESSKIQEVRLDPI